MVLLFLASHLKLIQAEPQDEIGPTLSCVLGRYIFFKPNKNDCIEYRMIQSSFGVSHRPFN
jgi:hypothetical protein